ILHDELGINDLDGLRAAAQEGRIRTVKGLSDKTEASILAGIASLETRSDRLLLGEAEEIINGLVAELSTVKGVTLVEPAGSYRRRQETIGDIDLLAETSEPERLVEHFAGLPGIERVLGAGGQKAAVVLAGGPQVDLMIMPPGEAGTYLIHFTGSRDHNIRLRGIARDRGWSLSEKGFLRVDADGTAVTPAELRTFPTEAEAYAFLELPYIEPELRQDRGEIEAAQAGRLPTLVRLKDLRGDLHSHSDWSDGVHSIEQMAEAARQRGHAYQVLTDHTRSLGIANGLTPDRVRMQRAIVAELNARFAREEAAGSAPAATPAEGFRLLHGCELEIRSDAGLDYDDDLLAQYDLVVASVHVGRSQPREQLTRRVLAGIHSPHVDVIAHPSGRKVQGRPDLDLDWDLIFAEAARTGTALEMNGSDHRLDLNDQRARRAVAAGCLVALDSDAHRIEEFRHLGWAVDQARRAWVEPASVLNTRSRADLLAWVQAKGERLAAG
ncbi:MAG TPA: PHP domain-containing protein, partial [Candidatus Limnocylindrales bacterium]